MNFCGMRNGRTLAAMSRRRSLLYKLHRVVTFSCLVGVLTSLAAYGEGVTRAENNIPGNKEIKWVQGSQHGYVPPSYKGRDIVR